MDASVRVDLQERPSPPRISTGVPGLDDLLGGGPPAGTATLLYGAPFTGKQVLQQATFVAAAVRGIPVTYVLPSLSASAMSRRLRATDAHFAAAEEAGLVTYVDLQSRVLGEPSAHPCALPVEDPGDAARLAQAIAARHAPAPGPGLLAVQSASTLLVELGPARAFQFLRTLLDPVLRSGGVGSVSLQAGLHSETEVQMAKRLCGATIELRRRGHAHALRLEGHGAPAGEAWIEYAFTPRSFRLAHKPTVAPSA